MYQRIQRWNRSAARILLSFGGLPFLFLHLKEPQRDSTLGRARAQSPIGNASRNTRILEFDLESESVVAEFAYRFQPVTEFGDTNPAEMKVSGLTALDEHRLLVLERTDKVAKLYRVDLRKATNILGTKWDDVATSPSLEALDELQLADEGVDLPKDLVIDLSTLPDVPEKIEGVVHLNGKTIAISNDNDFGIGSFTISGSSCTLVDSGVKSQLLIIETDKPLK